MLMNEFISLVRKFPRGGKALEILILLIKNESITHDQIIAQANCVMVETLIKKLERKGWQISKHYLPNENGSYETVSYQLINKPNFNQ